jgi:undecaprenyl-diphosphatase
MAFPQWDTDLFLLLNGLHCPIMDSVMWFISHGLTFIPLYALVLFWLCKDAGGRKAVLIVLGAVLCIVLADRISSGLIKPAVERLRPTHEPTLTGLVHIVRGYEGGRYGFVSSHATNHFAFAVFSLLLMRRKWYGFGIVGLAGAISYSRIYLGVHYPLDVLCGGVLGVAIGAGMYRFIVYLLNNAMKKRPSSDGCRSV